MRAAARLAIVLVLWAGLAAPGARAEPGFEDWAAVIVAGDWRAGSGKATEAFDNARRDVAAALVTAGFRRENLREFSVRPRRYQPRPGKSDVDHIYDGLSELTGRSPAGCFVYFTSHGVPEGVVIGSELLAPSVLAAMLDEACGARPTVVVVSACYSGVFVPELAAPNRLVLTAARPDRSSFGCGESDRYPYFDDCFLRAFPTAADFAELASGVRACVADRERKTGMSPPSEPQVSIGAGLTGRLPPLRAMQF